MIMNIMTMFLQLLFFSCGSNCVFVCVFFFSFLFLFLLMRGHFLCPDILRWSCGFSLSICNGSSRRLHDVTVWNAIAMSIAFRRTIYLFYWCCCCILTALRFRTVQDVNDKPVFITRFAHFLFTFCFIFLVFFLYFACLFFFFENTVFFFSFSEISHESFTYFTHTKWLGRLLVLYASSWYFVICYNCFCCRYCCCAKRIFTIISTNIFHSQSV